MKRLWLWMMTILTTLCLFACSKPGDPPPDDPPTTYTVAIVKETQGCGEVSGAGTYEEGATVTVTATVADGYAFLGWYEGEECVSMEKTYVFTLTGDRNLTAKWYELPPPTPPAETPTTYTVTIIKATEGHGEASGGGTYEEGTKVTLTATAVQGYGFLGWYENGSRVTKETTYEFTLTGDRTLVARWYQLGNTGGWSGAV